MRLPLATVATALAVAFALPAGAIHTDPAAGRAGPSQSDPAGLRFADGADRGLAFRHDHGGSGAFYIVESMGSGAAFLDFDRDGWLDAYLVQGAPLPPAEGGDAAGAGSIGGNALFRNRGGRFEPVRRGGAADTGYGMGVTAGDFDNDGFADVYVTNWGPNALYRNNGDGTFTRLPAGVADDRWGSSATWVDVDSDGWLDLFVVNYLRWTLEDHRPCNYGPDAIESYCGPELFGGEGDVLYRNRGDGSFEEISTRAGIVNPTDGKGLGVIAGDLDGDGDADVYVANDTRPNFLWINDGDGRFVDDALLAGVGYSGEGRAQAGMGVDQGDIDGDGDPDLIVTHFQDDYNTLYLHGEDATFRDATADLGLRAPTTGYLAFGVDFADLDHDGDLDLAVANGHIFDAMSHYNPAVDYAQANQVFVNRGTASEGEAAGAGSEGAAGPPESPAGHGATAAAGDPARPATPAFEPLPGAALGPLARPAVSRGMATGDVDNDGDLDLLVANNHDRADLAVNELAGPGTRSFQLRLVGTASNRDGVGARVVIAASGRRQTAERVAASSYLSQNDPRMHFGLAGERAADVTVRWPDGSRETWRDVPAGRVSVLRQGRGEPVATAGRPVTRPHRGEAVRIARTPLARRGWGQPVSTARSSVSRWERGEAVPTSGATGPPRQDPRLAEATELLRGGDAVGARDVLLQVLEERPDWPPAEYLLGVALLQLGRPGEALPRLEAAARGLEPQPGILGSLARARMETGDPEGAAAAAERALEIDEEAPILWHILGRARAATGDLAGAEQAFSRAAGLAPDTALFPYDLGVVRSRRGDDDGAAAAWVEALSRDPEYVPALVNLGALYLRRDDVRGARQMFSRARALRPDDPDLAFNLGLANRAMGRDGDAMALFQEALSRGGDSARLHQNLGTLYREQGDLAAARRHLEAAVERDPELGSARLALGTLELDEGNAAAALEQLEPATELRPGDVQSWVSLGRARVATGANAAARQAFERALEIEPEHRDAHYQLGQLLRDLDEDDAARRHLETYRELQSDYQEGRDLESQARSALTRAVDAIEAGNPLAARPWLEQAVELDPELVEPRVHLADLMNGNDENEAALRLLQPALERAPDDPRVRFEAGRALIALGRHDEALPHLERAVGLTPHEIRYRNGLALVLLAGGEPGRALELLQVSRQLDPDTAETWRLLAVAYDATGDAAAAEHARARYEELRQRER